MGFKELFKKKSSEDLADELKKLKTQRVKEEGRLKLRSKIETEREKIRSAKPSIGRTLKKSYKMASPFLQKAGSGIRDYATTVSKNIEANEKRIGLKNEKKRKRSKFSALWGI